MKKNLIAALLVVALLVCAFAFAEDVDTSEWNYTVFEQYGIALKLPTDFVSLAFLQGEMSYYGGENADYMVYLDVESVDESFADVQALCATLQENPAAAEAELVDVGGIEAVRVTSADDYTYLLFGIDENGNTYCVSVGYNLSDEGEEVPGSEEMALEILDSAVPADQVPAVEEEDEWQYYVLGETGIAMKMPGDYVSNDYYVGDMRVYDEEGNAILWLQVTREETTCDSMQAVADTYAQDPAYADVKLENLNGVEIVSFRDGEMADGSAQGFFILSDGFVYRFCLYDNLTEDVQVEDTEEMAAAIVASVIPADQVPAE